MQYQRRGSFCRCLQSPAHVAESNNKARYRDRSIVSAGVRIAKTEWVGAIRSDGSSALGPMSVLCTTEVWCRLTLYFGPPRRGSKMTSLRAKPSPLPSCFLACRPPFSDVPDLCHGESADWKCRILDEDAARNSGSAAVGKRTRTVWKQKRGQSIDKAIRQRKLCLRPSPYSTPHVVGFSSKEFAQSWISSHALVKPTLQTLYSVKWVETPFPKPEPNWLALRINLTAQG